jgi:hypothetical protein
MKEKRKITDRRKIERRTPRKGVNVRHDDRDGYVPKRVKWAQKEK